MGKHLDSLIRFANRIERKIFIEKIAESEGEESTIVLKDQGNLPEGWRTDTWDGKLCVVTGKGTWISEYPVKNDTEIACGKGTPAASAAPELGKFWQRQKDWLNQSGNEKAKNLPTSAALLKEDRAYSIISDYNTFMQYNDGLLKNYVPSLDKSDRQESIRELNNDKTNFIRLWYATYPDFDEIVKGSPAASRSGGGQRYPSIERSLQEKLNYILPKMDDSILDLNISSYGLKLPLDPDSKRGPLTNKALEIYWRWKTGKKNDGTLPPYEDIVRELSSDQADYSNTKSYPALEELKAKYPQLKTQNEQRVEMKDKGAQ